jgi:predicted alpha/beta-hydrolase family hydrolase
MDVPEVRGRLAERGAAWIAPDDAVAWLVVGHGAGAGMDHPLLVGFCRTMAEHGIATVRFNFPYTDAGRRAPDPEPYLRKAWVEVFAAVMGMAEGLPVLAGGKSLGGRIASLCVADGMPARGLVFLGYPLHSPTRPERVRAEHLARIGVPMLFLQGTRDPFARADLLEAALAGLGERATLVWIEGGDHSFEVPGRRSDPREIGASLAGHAGPWVRRVAGA